MKRTNINEPIEKCFKCHREGVRAGFILTSTGFLCSGCNFSIQTIIESTWSEKEDGLIPFKHVLHLERNGLFIAYNRFQSDGSGWGTKTFVDMEKAIRYIVKMIHEDKKFRSNCRNMRIITPAKVETI